MLLRLLESDSDEALIHKHLSAWWIEFDQRSAAYTRDWVLAKQGFSQFLQQLGSSLTASQQQRLERRIAALRQDLATLQAPEQPAAKLPTAVLCTVSTS
jgi:hypothetical protein